MINELRKELNYTTTDNDAIAHKSTLSKCLDFFAIGGSLRTGDIDNTDIFKNAYYENKLNAIRLAFMFRDIRFGQGQRQPFRDQLNWLSFNEPNIACKILKYVPEYGRWDDLYAAFETPCENIALQIIEEQVNSDIINIVYNKPISILGKWLKRINTSNYKSVEYAHKIRRHLNLTCKDYRKLCKKLSN